MSLDRKPIPYAFATADKISAFALALTVMLSAFVFCSVSASAQETDDDLPEGVVPPPLNLVSKEERTELEAETKMKNRTKLALDLIETRLTKSENFSAKEDFQESLNQLGRFQGLIRYTFNYLKRNEDEKGSFKNFKRFEMTLREFIPRLELLRRELPYKYGYHVGRMIIFVRDARADALEPLFEDTVIPEGGAH